MYICVLNKNPVNLELMKRLSSLTLIVVIPWLLAAQECRYGINQYDEYTGCAIKKTLGVIESNVIGATGFINFLKIDSTYYLQLCKSYSGHNDYFVPEGGSLELRLDNREVIEFSTDESFEADVTETPADIITSITVKVHANEKDIEKLTEQKVVRYRLSLSDGYLEDNIKPKFQQNVRNAACCILQ